MLFHCGWLVLAWKYLFWFIVVILYNLYNFDHNAKPLNGKEVFHLREIIECTISTNTFPEKAVKKRKHLLKSSKVTKHGRINWYQSRFMPPSFRLLSSIMAPQKIWHYCDSFFMLVRITWAVYTLICFTSLIKYCKRPLSHPVRRLTNSYW